MPIIEGPRAVPPIFGLLPALTVVEGFDFGPDGVLSWRPEACAAGGYDDVCAGGQAAVLGTDLTVTGNEDGKGGSTTNPDAQAQRPFVVWVEDPCQTPGDDVGERRARATRLLLACQSRLIAHELWTGAYADLVGPPLSGNRRLTAGATILSDTAVGPKTAIGMLEEAGGQCCGQRLMLHCSPLIVAHLMGAGVRRDPAVPMLLSPLDNIVVADAGYPGTLGPTGTGAPLDAGTQWIIATGMVGVRLGAVQVIGDTDAEFDVRINNRVVIAERLAAAVWDPCCHFAVPVAVNTAQ